jgi:Fe-S-cluster-containing dehydrogenase component
MSVTRRRFLGGLATAAGAIAGVRTSRAGGREKRSRPYAILHDITLCIGCRTCEESCNQKNKLPEPKPPLDDEKVFETHRRLSPTQVTVVNRYRKEVGEAPAVFRKHQCMHCVDPCCASVCFVDAFTKTPEGPVLYDPSVCVGCRYCVAACPYHALSYQFDDPGNPLVVRCAMCFDRVKKGEPPACVENCPEEALVFGPRDELLKEAHKRIKENVGQYINHVYGEHEYGGTSFLILSGIPFSELDLYDHAPRTSIPEIGGTYLAKVPYIIAAYPPLLVGIYAIGRHFERRREAGDWEEGSGTMPGGRRREDKEDL